MATQLIRMKPRFRVVASPQPRTLYGDMAALRLLVKEYPGATMAQLLAKAKRRS